MTYSILFSSHRLLKVLYVIALVAIATAILNPRLAASWFRGVERWFRGAAADSRKAILLAAAFPMAVRFLMLPWYPPPPPQIHDEFSYLLQGDTFAHGRVANATPPYWQHFQTEYVLLQPTYASQYQPAQGLVLAFGEIVFGHPWWGVWVSVGLMCAAICWGLRQIVPPAWALAGALGAGLQFGIFGLWMNSYFGGAVAAAAGALVFGSLIRMKRPQQARSAAAVCAFGMILIFATRPFEALLWSAVALWYTVFYVMRGRPAGSQLTWARLLVPFALVFAAGAGSLAWYNWRITGNPANPPYLEYRRVYGTPQPYWWQAPVKVDHFDYPELRDNYINQVRLYEQRHSLDAMLGSEQKRLSNFWRFFVGPFFTPALLFLWYVIRDKRTRPWLLASIPFIVGKATYHAWYPAQNGPETILIVLILLQCWRHMRAAWRPRQVGLAMSRMLAAAVCLTVVLGNVGRASEPVLLKHHLVHLPPIWESLYPARRLRDEVSAVLEQVPGKHLVFVKYSPGHCFCEEWVFNGAELKEQRIVYARPYTPESDEALAAYLSDHDVWVIEPDLRPYRLARVISESQWAELTRPEGDARGGDGTDRTER